MTVLFETPGTDAAVLANITSYTQVKSREVGYEVPAAVVYARADGWYRLRLADGRYGWTPAADAGTYFAYQDLPLRRLSYLTGSWSGFIWPQAGAGLPLRLGASSETGNREVPANVIDSQRIGGSLWFRVEILDGNRCDSASPATRAAGWIPAYGRDGTPTAWYYSRGC